MTEEEIPDTPEYGFGGAAYARARKLKQKELQAQAWHDANVGGAPMSDDEIGERDDDALRARVAKLEKALKTIYHAAGEDALIKLMVEDALKDAPQ